MARTRTPAAPAPHEVSFAVTPGERKLIDKITRRYAAMRRAQDIPTSRADRTEIEMDLAATHANGCPMDFAKLLAADDFNFAHDVAGIRQHISRTDGTLRDCFLPRCSRHERH